MQGAVDGAVCERAGGGQRRPVKLLPAGAASGATAKMIKQSKNVTLGSGPEARRPGLGCGCGWADGGGGGGLAESAGRHA